MVDTRHALSIRLTAERYEWLRRQAFDRRVPMQQIVDEAIDRYRAGDETTVSAERISA